MVTRRDVLAVAGATMAVAACRAMATEVNGGAMYGLIGSARARPGQRDALLSILLENAGALPGCHSYVVAEDLVDPDMVWITEVWDSMESHKASLALPGVRDAIARAMPLFAGFEQHTRTRPVGGHGLALAA